MIVPLLAGCASYSGSALRPGQASEAEVLQVMGQPAMRWQSSDGSVQLAYPHGPMGVHSYMVFLGPDGKLQHIDNVMNNNAFSQIRSGMNKEQVLRTIGPPEPSWTIYFKARDELVWEWRYCDDWGALARFDVLFDGTAGNVRSTMSQTEDQMGLCGPEGGCTCGR